jgi:predicted RNA binding protein YcfA (HicA-like mRNA interferase family)
MKSIKPKEIISLLEERGFKFIRQKGSHRLYKKDTSRVTVPFHNKDLKPGTLRNILKQAGLTEADL